MSAMVRLAWSMRAVFGLVLSLLATPLAAQQAGPIQQLDAEEARRQAMSGDILLIDLRTPEEWRQSGIPDAAIGIDVSAKDFGAKLMEAIGGDRTKPVALICRTGGRSGYASQILAQNGFTSIYDVSEGTHGSGAGPGWLRRGLPTRTPEQPVASAKPEPCTVAC